MRKFRRIAGLLLSLCLLLCGCSTGEGDYAQVVESMEPAATAAADESVRELHIGVTLPTGDEFSAEYLRIFTRYARENGARVTALSADNDAQEQIRQVQDMVDAGCDVVYCHPVEPDALSAAAEYAHEKGVPFVAAEEELNSDLCTTKLLVDQSTYGYVQGLCVVYLLERDPELTLYMGHLWGDETRGQEKQRWAGFQTATEEFMEEGRLVLLAEAHTRHDRSNAVSAVEQWRRIYPEMNCIAANHDGLAFAVGQSLQEQGVDMENFHIIGVEGTEEGLRGVQSGCMYATAKILDETQRIQYFCSIAIEAALGHTVEKQYFWLAEGAVVTAANVNDYL